MSLRFRFAVLTAFGVAALAATAPAQAQQTAYAIANGGTTLIRFQTNNPGAAVVVGNFSGPGFLDGIDFRPLTGELFGYLDSSDTLYRVNLNTAALTAVATGTGTGATNTNLLGMDFNPTIDRVRIVTDSTQNLVYNPGSPAGPTVNTTLAYAAGDINQNASPLVVENAYSNNVANGFATTIQYGIDYGTDSLVTIANNAGTLTTVGTLGLNINNTAPFVGFDIFTTLAGVNTGYAILDTTVGTTPRFYTINLTTGAATSVGGFGAFQQVYSLAVVPTAAVAAPEPGALALIVPGALAMVGTIARRRRRA